MTKCHAFLVHSFEFYLVFFADDFPGVARTSLIQRDAAVETIVNNIVETILVNENCVNEVKIVSILLALAATCTDRAIIRHCNRRLNQSAR